jgi:hypothetical protein
LKLCYIPIFCDPLRKVFLANCNDPDKSGYLKGFHSNLLSNDTGTLTVLPEKLSKAAMSILRNRLQEGGLAHSLDY